MSSANDIVHDLESWLTGADPHSRAADVALIRRAIEEINTLREKLGERSTTESIGSDSLNASNDE